MRILLKLVLPTTLISVNNLPDRLAQVQVLDPKRFRVTAFKAVAENLTRIVNDRYH